MIKIDMSKAYDKVNWDFLMAVLRAFGILKAFYKLVFNCIASLWFSVMMNGNLKGFFQIYKGASTERSVISISIYNYGISSFSANLFKSGGGG